MGTRTHIVAELTKEVLGPRGGYREILREDPRSEYIVGILQPAEATNVQEIDDAELAGSLEDGAAEEDEADAAGLISVPPISPSLDPRSLPRSIGLSFTIDGSEPTLRVCCTWARYNPHQSGWERAPTYYLSDLLDATRTHEFITSDAVRVQVRPRQISDGRFKVTIYLVNTLRAADPDRPSTPEYIFQPQIRVALGKKTKLVPLDSIEGEKTGAANISGEELQLELLYDHRRGFARGHMCGATWLDIDPERNAGTLEAERPNAPPFAWLDRQGLSNADAQQFTPADIRTEFLPIYGVEAPSTEWDEQLSERTPELRASVLSETWEPADLTGSLRPILDAYREWLRTQRAEIINLPTEQRPIAEQSLTRCDLFAWRLEESINTLGTDERARLAFCFANAAMEKQSVWSRSRGLEWRPFQLAFLLATIPSVLDASHPDRHVCDLLWFPTGGGKTEAYLALSAFLMGYRRLLTVLGERPDRSCAAGTTVISRYTLRLLTIQQFRRALAMVTACEMLRVSGLERPGHSVGWRPKNCTIVDPFLWGTARFSTGLWVGGNVTPNNLQSVSARVNNQMVKYVGAIDILRGARPGYSGPDMQLARSLSGHSLKISGDPAQVTACPCCRTLLSVPEGQGANSRGLSEGQYRLHVVHSGGAAGSIAPARVTDSSLALDVRSVQTATTAGAFTTTIDFSIPAGGRLNATQIDEWWERRVAPIIGIGRLLCARPSRPGYFLVSRDGPTSPIVDFEIFCPNPNCELNQQAWAESVPVLRSATRVTAPTPRMIRGGGLHADLPAIPDQWQDPPLLYSRVSAMVQGRVPIPALTVDDQVYARCPSLLVATADKFARLAFEPKASSLFGNVTHYHARAGYYREGAPPLDGLPTTHRPHPPGGAGGHNRLHVRVERFRPPELILQDELHLIEGPLGSMVGLYETIIEELCSWVDANGRRLRPKYVASTATIRQAGDQVRALFDRELSQFPPQGLSIDDSFFAVTREPHQLDEAAPGRLYLGLAAPGKGAQTPIVRIWSRLLQTGYERYSSTRSQVNDRFWTLAGYFNAVRELAGAATLYRQDIPERMRATFATPRDLGPDEYMELSSRVDSVELPGRLADLEREAGVAAVLATSMFGTGVDVNRLGLMVVHGQPKTTSTYIQATGRVGRQSGALVVTFLRASRPRDLNHYEFFSAYHRALYRHVEAITISPFAPKARDRALGPMAVALLRQGDTLRSVPVDGHWKVQQRLNGSVFHSEANRMAFARHSAEVRLLPQIAEQRAQQQPMAIRPPAGVTANEMSSELDAWQRLARVSQTRDDLVYHEPAVTQSPSRAVVLGDPQHATANLDQAFENAPQSLREIEETTTFRV